MILRGRSLKGFAPAFCASCYNLSMKSLNEFKRQIDKCSRCGICQGSCPIYKVTGNDCTVSRGQFVMLKALLNGELKMSKTINRYLDLCLKCGACTKFCPSGINVVDVIAAAKHEYFMTHPFEKMISFVQEKFLFGFFVDFMNLFSKKTKSKKFEKSVLYFGGCRTKLKGDSALVRVMNSLGVEVVNPSFSCCGIPFFARGDFKTFEKYLNKYVAVLKKYKINEVVTTCASCEKTLKDYARWTVDADTKEFLLGIKVSNVYEYIKNSGVELSLKRSVSVTFHKPCNIDNYSDVEWILKNTKNLNYVEMKDFDACCGLNGLSKVSEYKIMRKVFDSKRENIIKSGVRNVLTSCLGCEVALNAYSFGAYRVFDMLEFLADNVEEL